MEARAREEGLSRSLLIEKALIQYLDMPRCLGRNAEGLDAHYFKKKLIGVLELLDCISPDEMILILNSLVKVAEREVSNQAGGAGSGDLLRGTGALDQVETCGQENDPVVASGMDLQAENSS